MVPRVWIPDKVEDGSLGWTWVRRAVRAHGFFLAMLVFSVLWLVPVWWMAVTAFKPQPEIFTLPPRWIPSHFTLDHVRRVLTEWPFLRWVVNSFVVAGGATLLSLLLSVPAAYSFARLRWPGRDVVFIVFVSSMLLPWQINAVPLFFLMNKLKLLNTYASVILPISAMPIGVFLLRQFFVNFPRDLEDAARIDGCSYLGILIRIVLPNSVAALVAMGLYMFIFAWNEFFWSLIALQKPEKLTLPIGLKMLHGAHDLEYGLLMAGAFLASLPALALFILFRRRIIRGIALTSGIKG